MSTVDLPFLMKEFAENAVGFANDQYQVDLDYSEESIRRVEGILATLYEELIQMPAGSAPQSLSTDEFAEVLCNMFGAYIGETIRRLHGGQWKTETLTANEPTVCLQVGTTLMFPNAKVYKRLTDGVGDDVWFYYQVFKQRFQD